MAKEANLTDWCQTPLDVNKFMNNWVMDVHFPALIVNFDSVNEIYDVFQEPYLPLEYLPSGYNYTWNIPLPIIDQTGKIYNDWLPSGKIIVFS